MWLVVFFFYFGVISEVLLPKYSSNWILAILKAGAFHWPGNDKLKVFRLNLIWFEKFGFHEYSSDLKLDIVKERKSDWLGNDRKRTSDSNFKLRFSKRPLDLIRGFWLEVDVIWEFWQPLVIMYVKIGNCKTRNVRLTGQRQKNDVTYQLQT